MQNAKNTMKTREEIEEQLKKISADERLRYEPANIEVNAPLALIQTYLEATQKAFQWVLGYREYL